ncbi:MAG: M48 family metalloprotease [Wenzhouxiangella sp.]|nr:M48 family metalloprotease [Wenzhouxiangella sp.]
MAVTATRIRRAVVALMGAVALSGASAIAQDSVRLPEMGSTTTRVLSPEEERTFATDIERYFRANGMLIEDPFIVDYIEDMSYRLVSYSTRNQSDFHFFVLKDPSINAFAAPAGVIGLHSGLILLAQNEAEVAGVVAHEIAHITQDHLARAMENQQNVSMPTMLATLGLAIASGMAGGGSDATGAILMSGMGLATQFQINHTRQSEAEADRVGIGLLARGGYDPDGMTRFFERLNIQSRSRGDGVPEYLRTHPLTINRVAEARARAAQFPQIIQKDDDLFHYAQARLRVLMSRRPEQAIEYFRLRLRQQDRPALPMHYGLSLAAVEARQMSLAKTHLDVLLDASPNNQLYRLLHADWALANGDVEDSLAILSELYHQYAGSQMVTVQYAQALMHEPTQDRAIEASAVLRRHLHANPTDLTMTELYAQAAAKAGDPVRAGEAQAESYYIRGGLDEAIEQLERVLDNEPMDYYQRARINARIVQLRREQFRLAQR